MAPLRGSGVSSVPGSSSSRHTKPCCEPRPGSSGATSNGRICLMSTCRVSIRHRENFAPKQALTPETSLCQAVYAPTRLFNWCRGIISRQKQKTRPGNNMIKLQRMMGMFFHPGFSPCVKQIPCTILLIWTVRKGHKLGFQRCCPPFPRTFDF